MLYALSLYSDICQLFFNKTGGGKIFLNFLTAETRSKVTHTISSSSKPIYDRVKILPTNQLEYSPYFFTKIPLKGFLKEPNTIPQCPVVQDSNRVSETMKQIFLNGIFGIQPL